MSAQDRRMVTWLHVADLHIKEDLRTEEENSDYLEQVSTALYETLNNLPATVQKPDLIFFTGDLAFSGREYERANDFFDGLIEAVGVDKQHIFVIPGNHDMVRETLDKAGLPDFESPACRDYLSDPDNMRKHQACFEKFRTWHNSYFDAAPLPDDTTCDVVHTALGEMKIGVLRVNSALCHYDKGCERRLWVSQKHLRDSLKSFDNTEKLRFALFHHKTDDLQPDESAAVEQILAQDVDILLYGHRHYTSAVAMNCRGGDIFLCGTGAWCDPGDPTKRYRFFIGTAWYDERQISVSPFMYSPNAASWALDRSAYQNMPPQSNLPEPARDWQFGCLRPHWKRDDSHPRNFRIDTQVRRVNNSYPDILPIIGRDKLVDDIVSDLARGGVFVLYGIEGIGKTALAKAAANSLFDKNLVTHLLWIDSASVSDLTTLAANANAKLNECKQVVVDEHNLPAQIVRELHNSHSIMVLDGCDNLIDEKNAHFRDPNLHEWMAAVSPPMTLLLTAQVRIPTVQANRCRKVPDLDADHSWDLFKAHAVGIADDQQQRRVFDDICNDYIGRVPSAIIELAAHAQDLGMTQLAQCMQNFRDLDSEKRTKGYFDSYFENLNNGAKQLLYCAAVLPADISYLLIERFLSEPIIILSDFSQRSFLTRNIEDRYTLLPRLRRYIRGRLSKEDEAFCRQAYVDVFANEAAKAEPDSGCDEDTRNRTLNRIMAEWQNIEDCAHAAKDDLEVLGRICDCLLQFMIFRAYYKPCQKLFKSEYELLQIKLDGRDISQCPGLALRYDRTYNQMGVAHQYLEEWDDARKYLEESLRALELFFKEDHLMIAKRLNSLAWIHHRSGENNKALQVWDKAVGHYENAGTTPQDSPELRRKLCMEEGMFLSSRGYVLGMMHRENEAIADLTKAINIQTNCGDPRLGQSYTRLAQVYAEMYDYHSGEVAKKAAKAADFFQKALEFFKGNPDPYDEGLAHAAFGDIHLRQRNREPAEQQFREAIELFERCNDLECGLACLSLARVLKESGNLDGALESARRAIELLAHIDKNDKYKDARRLEDEIRQLLSPK